MPVAHCTFLLNGKKTSWLLCDGYQFRAFSGNNGHENKPEDTAISRKGPIPRGRYYIVDRQSGGHLGWLHDLVHDMASGTPNRNWFALYRQTENGNVSDTVFVRGVKRGHFRLHPVGNRGISEGCITLVDPARFEILRAYLKARRVETIPGSKLLYYGTLDVQ